MRLIRCSSQGLLKSLVNIHVNMMKIDEPELMRLMGSTKAYEQKYFLLAQNQIYS